MTQYIVEPQGDGFIVRIDPPISGLMSSRMFERHREARGWASGLRMTYRGEIVDRVLEGGPRG